MGDYQSLAKVQQNDIQCSILIHYTGHFMTYGNNAGYIQIALGTSDLAVPNCPVFRSPGNNFRKDLLHNVPMDIMDIPMRLNVLWLLGLRISIFENRYNICLFQGTGDVF